MKKTSLTDDAFVIDGDSKGNPYEGDDPNKGIDYDGDECRSPKSYQDGNICLISTSYRIAAKKLVRYLSTKKGQTILEIGPGTGISTLELILNHPWVSVISIDISKGMIKIAKYKFHQETEEDLELIKNVDDNMLLDYWEKFREESKKHKDKVKFILDDIEKTNKIKSESIDGAIGSQSLHWTDYSKTLRQLQKFLKKGGELIFDSFSDFYEDQEYNSLEYGFLYNDFVKYVVDEVNKKVEIRTDYYNLSRPKDNLDSFKSIASKEGFNLEQIGVSLNQIDMQIFIKNHVPAIIRQLTKSKPENEEEIEELERITYDAIAKTIKNPNALNDMKHKYGITPTFRLKKI